MSELKYIDYQNLFDGIDCPEAFCIENNVKLFKSLEILLNEISQISKDQQVQNIRKRDIIVEMAQIMESIYLNSNKPYMISEIGSTIVDILSKKDKITTVSYIYEVLESKYKGKYISNYISESQRRNTNSKKYSDYNRFKECAEGFIKYSQVIPEMDYERIKEYVQITNQIDEVKENINQRLKENYSTKYSSSNNLFLPVQKDNNSNKYNDNAFTNVNDGFKTCRPSDQKTEEEVEISISNSPKPNESKYYHRLTEYIEVLDKLRTNVLKFPPSPELDDMLDSSLQLEIQMLMPCIDMKFKRSIPQLDETIEYANRQSLNGASSVMNEDALIRDNKRGYLPDPNDAFNKFLEITHKMTPEQIDTRRPFISSIRKKMASFTPHLYFNLLWYEGSDRYNHILSMGKFARSNLLRKKITS